MNATDETIPPVQDANSTTIVPVNSTMQGNDLCIYIIVVKTQAECTMAYKFLIEWCDQNVFYTS